MRPLRLLPLLALLPFPAHAASPTAPLAETVMAQVSAAPSRRAAFTQEKRLSSLSVPLLSRGTLSFTRPSHLEQDTESPKPEHLVIDGDQLTVSVPGQPPRVVALDDSPVLRALADTLRAAVAGDLPTLQRLYAIEEQGTPGTWRLLLTPRSNALRGALVRVTLDGSGPNLRQLDIQQTNGDEQRMTIQPLP